MPIKTSVGSEIKATDITVKNLPKSAIPSTSFRDPNKIIGKTITAGPVVNGSIIRAEHLSSSSSLLVTLRTLAPEGWCAVELPVNSSLGLQGLKRGDKVCLFGEVGITGGTIDGTMIDTLVENAIILSLPSEKAKNYIVAVPSEYAKVVAEKVARNSPVVVVLPEAEKLVENPEINPIEIPQEGDV